ncbi:hypothetical protein B0H17DRAFT_1171122 [Mycena rosella]|uniref:Protein LCHN n=1 Tax=Mycena rosella TaxID=1033263 RepID=A0AAD7CXZ7_MYCRO|nr:hypothetical protein B0H17DRAFT_1171122 [Mycena rosella]
MSALDSKGRYPQDIVAIFHASFHPTQGNIIDWALKANDDLNLDNLEFSALPSGLHLVEQDVVYFTKDAQRGVCVFRRRKTIEAGHRGFRLSSLGILLARSARPRPWLHTAALKALTTLIYARFESTASLVPSEADWEPARAWFEARKAVRADLGGAGDWRGWGYELLERRDADAPSTANPTLHLPHLLRILGPSSLTLYKHVLGRRRILIYTLPPVEAASILCQVAADMAYEHQVASPSSSASSSSTASGRGRLHGRCSEGISVLGMVTLNDLDRLQKEGSSGRGWVACTTDAIFLEKPACYDLLIDLTTSTPNKATRPTFYSSRPVPPLPSGRGPTHKLSVVRFSWSDVKLWNELNRILRLDASHHHHHHPHPSSAHSHSCCLPAASFSDAGGKGGRARRRSRRGRTRGALRGRVRHLRGAVDGRVARELGGELLVRGRGGRGELGERQAGGDDDFSLRAISAGNASGARVGDVGVRSLGMGIEGGPRVASAAASTSRAARRASAMSWSSGRATVTSLSPSSPNPNGKGKAFMSPDRDDADADGGEGARQNGEDGDGDTDSDGEGDGQILTTLSLLQTLHAHTAFQLEALRTFLPAEDDGDSKKAAAKKPTPKTVVFTPKDMAAFELGPLSGMDARFLEWFAGEYGGGVAVVVRRGWRETLGAVFGYG